MQSPFPPIPIPDLPAFQDFLIQNPQFEYAMRRIARHLLRDSHAVDEALQEMFLRAANQLHDGVPIINFWGWGKQTITYVCFELVRKKQRGQHLPLLDSEPDPIPDPATTMEWDETNSDLWLALQLLQEPERYVLRGPAYEVPRVELATSLGVSESTVRSTRNRRA